VLERTVQLQLPYKGTVAPAHAAGARRASGLAAAFLLCGCSFSYQLDKLFAKKDDLQYTGSLPQPQSTAEIPPERDLLIARAAVTEALAKAGKDMSLPWENPDTGARGTITLWRQNGFHLPGFFLRATYARAQSHGCKMPHVAHPANGR
jgi:hypothetical protein